MINILRATILFVFTTLSVFNGFTNDSIPDSPAIPPASQITWVDSVLSSLTVEEKVAQLFMIRTYSNKDEKYYRETAEIIKKYNIGGLCFFQGGPITQAQLTNRLQEIAKTPMLIAMDAEWGLGMRLDSTFSFPYQMTLGSINNDSLIYQMGTEIASHLKQLGVHINFAPVIDINNNPANPVINSRSFGENKTNVTSKSIAYMKGLQDNGIIATAKHFPGHGDTDSDSHLTLPTISHNKQRLDSIELFPFKQLINNGLNAIMVAHLFVPSLDDTPNKPTTLSPKVVDGLLKYDLQFKGLVITDALDMKGVTAHHKAGELEVKAFLAGNDILLLPQDIELAINGMMNALKNGTISQRMLDERCKKILGYKFKAGLDEYKPVETSMVYKNIHSINNELISRNIYQEAITVIQNKNDLLPIRSLDTLNIASLSIGLPEITPFQQMLENYAPIDHFNVLKKQTSNQDKKLIQKLSDYNLVIIGIHNTSIFPTRSFGITGESMKLIEEISDSVKVVLVMFSSPYSLKNITFPDRFESIIIGHQDNRFSNEICAQIIMGGLDASGTLPVTANSNFPANTGIPIQNIQRFSYGLPEEVGLDRNTLNDIDSLVYFNINEKAIPGCQVLVAKDGKVVYNKSFGYHTYKKGHFVKNSDIYDLASVTKIAATTLSVMHLYDQGKMDIDYKLSWYLPYLTGSNKENMIIREVMAHQAGLKPWIPFYLYTKDDKKLRKDLYSRNLDENHTVKVAHKMYIDQKYKYTVYDSIIYSKLRKRFDYKYSDLGFYMLSQTIENLSNKPLDIYAEDAFYKPLGLQHLCFKPLYKFKLNEIIPTEKDDYFRNQLVHGYVHDPGAAMLGGVAGHAGLFGNANDLAVLMQMFLQNGYYGGYQYIKKQTVKEFTKQQFPLNDNRRGIGFDRPLEEDKEQGPTCESVSDDSYGHSGFTGTYTWTDPKYNLVYVFLSNRIHPTANNTKLIKMNTRTKIQQVIYDAILDIEKYEKKEEVEMDTALK